MRKNSSALLRPQGWPHKVLTVMAVALVTVFGTNAITALGHGGEDYGPAKRLIDNGYIITMDPELGDFKGDILLEGDKIVKIAPEIKVGRHVHKIDARDMVVMPGMVDNHRHMWQGVVHGMATDLTFGEYFQQVLFGASTQYTPDDVYLGNLMASYEAIDSGVTTVLDWSHINLTRNHALSAINALDKSNIRAVFAYGAPVTSSTVDGTPTMDDLLAAKARTDTDPLLGFAVATNSPELNPATKPKFLQDVARARELGVPITMHAGFVPNSPFIQELHDEGLLGNDMTFVHSNKYTQEDFELIAAAGAHVSSSPESEIQMNFGDIPLAAMIEAGVKPTVSLDTPSTSTGDLFSQLRMLVQTQREIGQQKAQAAGTPLQQQPYKFGDTLAWATINAAESLGMEDKIGSLSPGKQADIILLRATDLNLFLDKPQDVAVHAHPGNVDTVIVAGRILKRHGELVDANLKDLREQAKEANERLLQ